MNDPITIHHSDEPPPYHDLDSMAGTWSEEETAEFDRATASFRQIDEELWS
jgi:hypothetical protein